MLQVKCFEPLVYPPTAGRGERVPSPSFRVVLQFDGVDVAGEDVGVIAIVALEGDLGGAHDLFRSIKPPCGETRPEFHLPDGKHRPRGGRVSGVEVARQGNEPCFAFLHMNGVHGDHGAASPVRDDVHRDFLHLRPA